MPGGCERGFVLDTGERSAGELTGAVSCPPGSEDGFGLAGFRTRAFAPVACDEILGESGTVAAVSRPLADGFNFWAFGEAVDLHGDTGDGRDWLASSPFIDASFVRQLLGPISLFGAETTGLFGLAVLKVEWGPGKERDRAILIGALNLGEHGGLETLPAASKAFCLLSKDFDLGGRTLFTSVTEEALRRRGFVRSFRLDFTVFGAVGCGLGPVLERTGRSGSEWSHLCRSVVEAPSLESVLAPAWSGTPTSLSGAGSIATSCRSSVGLLHFDDSSIRSCFHMEEELDPLDNCTRANGSFEVGTRPSDTTAGSSDIVPACCCETVDPVCSCTVTSPALLLLPASSCTLADATPFTGLLASSDVPGNPPS